MIVTVVVAALAAGAGADVVARVDSIGITSAQLEGRVRVLAERKVTASREQALQALIDDVVLAAEARRLGLDRRPDVVAALEAQRRRVLAEAYEEKDVTSGISLKDDALRSIYHDSADSVRLKILKLQTREAAQAAMDRLVKGADFAKEAASSLDPASARNGGDTGVLVRAQLEPELVQQAFSAPIGALFGPISATRSWIVAKVVERTVGDEAGFVAKKDSIAAFARKQLGEHSRSERISELRAKAGVKVDEAFLASLGKRTDASPEELKHVIAVIGGKPLRYADLIGTVRELASSSGHVGGGATKLKLAWSEVDVRLLAAAAIAKGLGDAPDVRSILAPIERNILSTAVVERARASVAAPTDADVNAFYEANAARFRIPGKRTCSQIVAASQRDAEKLRARVVKGERFEDVARSASTDAETASRGGTVGEVSDAEVEALSGASGEPALAAAIRETPPGQVSGAAKTRAGWFLLKCGVPTAASQIPLPHVHDAILAQLTETRRASAAETQRAALRAKASISVTGSAPARAERAP